MKKLFFAAISLVCLMACSQDETMTPIDNPISGQDVLFTSTLGEASRTLYAEEYANSQAVKWVDGDLISVYGVDCGLKQADYEVTGASGTENDTPYYYAASLDKTAEAGVQWGDAPTSDFYAVYPSTPNSFRNNGNGSVTVKTTVRAAQRVAFEKTTKDGKTVWVAKHFQTESSNPTMTDAVMYAAKKDAASTNADGTPKAVDLNFNPFSTVLRFTMQGYQAHYADGTLVADKDSELAVTRIVLTAPNTKIAGDFDLTIKNDGTATASEGSTNQITIYPEYLPLKNKEWIQFDVFTIPQEGVVLPVNNPWTVEVETTSGRFTYKLIPTKVSTGAAEDAPLAAGSIHKLSIPQKNFTYQVEIGAEEWMRYVPRNVYISELSFPGSWYSTTSGYQDDTSLTSQWGNGVRAFHIDCRVTAKAGTYWKGHSFDLEDDGGYLAVAGTESSTELVIGVSLSQGKKVQDVLATIADCIQPDECAVVVLTIAEQHKRHGSVSPAHLGTVDPSTVLNVIKSMLDANATALKLYTTPITPTTTLNEVLGKMIVKVNANAQETKFSTYSNVPSTLISAASMASNSDFISGDIFGSTGTGAITNLFTAMQTEPMYWGKTAVTPAMNFYYHQAQHTGTSTTATSGSSTPSLYDRMKAIDDIVAQSDKLYYSDTYAWYQIAVGGYTGSGTTSSLNYDNVANSLNVYLKNIVDAKLNQTEFTTVTGSKITMKPSPLGIVLMNKVTSTNGLAVVEKILEMNKKFYLNRDTSKPEWPNGNPFEDMNQGTDDDDTPGSGGDGGTMPED